MVTEGLLAMIGVSGVVGKEAVGKDGVLGEGFFGKVGVEGFVCEEALGRSGVAVEGFLAMIGGSAVTSVDANGKDGKGSSKAEGCRAKGGFDSLERVKVVDKDGAVDAGRVANVGVDGFVGVIAADGGDAETKGLRAA